MTKVTIPSSVVLPRKQYTVKLYYSNLDDNLSTPHTAHIEFADVYADNDWHAELLAKRLEKSLGADDYRVE